MKYTKYSLIDNVNTFSFSGTEIAIKQNFSAMMSLLKVSFILLVLLVSACSSRQTINSATAKNQSIPNVSELTSQQSEKIDDKNFVEGITALQQNNLTTAQGLYNEFIRKNPGLSGAYVNLALIHFKQGKYEQALKLTNKALNLNPSQPQAYQLRAQINIKNGKINDAKKDYLKAIQLNPGYINAQYNLALLYDTYLQEINLAIKHYEIYMTLIEEPDEPTKEWINHLKGSLKNDQV